MTALTIHARFRLDETTRIKLYVPGEGGKWVPQPGLRVKLNPVQGEPFGSATPGGELTMAIANPDAAAEFQDAELGQEYDVFFSRVTPVSPSVFPATE